MSPSRLYLPIQLIDNSITNLLTLHCCCLAACPLLASDGSILLLHPFCTITIGGTGHTKCAVNPLIMNVGLPKLQEYEVIFPALKASAVMGYLPPEYITTGRFAEKSDIYAVGVVVLQILSGKRRLPRSMRSSVESGIHGSFIDGVLKGRLDEAETSRLGKISFGLYQRVAG
ncbi:hypothetical protein MLD38_036549 [Melastoma candidum]|nr:hypothetical protein MLD38_036549 [Melastoma candidum]